MDPRAEQSQTNPNEKVLELYRAYKKAVEDEYVPLMKIFNREMQMYVGDHYTADEITKLERAGRPPLVINHLKKACDLIQGHQIETMPDMKAFPIQGGDSAKADIRTEAVKWIVSHKNGNHALGMAIGSCIRVGIGWVNIEVDSTEWDEKVININYESVFRVMPDPNMTKLDMTDCEYILRRGYPTKNMAKTLYPKHAKLIDQLVFDGDTDPLWDVMKPQKSDARKGHIAITEMWYRSFDEVKSIVDLATAEVVPMDEADSHFHEAAASMIQGEAVTQYVPTMRLAIIAEDKYVLFDGPSPFSSKRFPFVPFAYTFLPEMDKWEYKIQGLIRILKDTQHELNKRRSQEMAAILSLPFSGWMFEEGSIEDEGQFSQLSGPSRMIKYKEGKPKPEMIMPPNFPVAIDSLAKIHRNDMMELGPTGEMLGIKTEAGQPGIVNQLRQQQGLTSYSPVFANIKVALRNVAVLINDYLEEVMPPEQLQKIVDLPVPDDFYGPDEVYDFVIDAVPMSSTARMSMFMQIVEAIKSGMVPPQLLPDIITELSDFPESFKLKIKQFQLNQQQTQPQMQPQGQPQGPPQGGPEGGMPPGMPQGMPPGMPQGNSGMPPM